MLVSGVVPLLVALALLPTLRRVRRRDDAPAEAADASQEPAPPLHTVTSRSPSPSAP